MTRLLDIFLSGCAIVFLMPILLPLIILLRLTGEGEVFYTQKRIGFRKQEFGLLKFATMLKNSPNIGSGSITIKDDPRVLPVGNFLRKTKLNELPQLINIFKGDMSIIGPRPLTPDMFDLYSVEHAEKITGVRPGLSGIGSIVFRDEEALIGGRHDPRSYYADQISPYKGELESWFVANRNLTIYFKCIVATCLVVIAPSIQIIDFFFRGLPQPRGVLREDLKLLRGR